MSFFKFTRKPKDDDDDFWSQSECTGCGHYPAGPDCYCDDDEDD